MVTLRCDKCINCDDDGFCCKLGEFVHIPLAKLFFGGAVDLFSGTEAYASECGIEREQKPVIEFNVEVVISEDTASDFMRH